MKTIRLLLLSFMIFAGSCQSQSVHDSIVLVNTGPYDKGRIAKLISKLSALSPKVIALDIAFPEYAGDTDDRNLYLALRDVKRLVLPSEISYEGQDYQGRDIISVYLTCATEFFVPNAKTGFVSAEVERDQGQIPRKFIVWQKGSYSEDIYHHFSVVTAMTFDSLGGLSFVQGQERLVDIDYKSGKRKFRIFSAPEILVDKLTKKDIEGKIVMMGFLGPGDDDKYFMPLGANPNEPYMYGLEYLANIVAQVLEYNPD